MTPKLKCHTLWREGRVLLKKKLSDAITAFIMRTGNFTDCKVMRTFEMSPDLPETDGGTRSSHAAHDTGSCYTSGPVQSSYDPPGSEENSACWCDCSVLGWKIYVIYFAFLHSWNRLEGSDGSNRLCTTIVKVHIASNKSGLFQWELVSGAPGLLFLTHSV